ncbi:hypothetical protein ATCV1_z284R [Acanthocystis turfacea chlorella virus 1]|uniref:Uncharacterized protein z284R n=1 Tax=Chlorovirus heliozoae TaxID=322019 RepID=A7K8P4_9PHYC|nr:hypothetical protein ATCV1_z284R [Acanthocystis turfacea chlorella virus 1]ABT16418.1 hypothetical protein ATCV1_z284R [Acanthocystis turfacea chlorella virus 1]
MPPNQVVIIPRPRQVRGHHRYEVAPVISFVCIAHLDARYLRDRVRLVGVFQRTRQEVLFAYRLWTVPWVDTTAS